MPGKNYKPQQDELPFDPVKEANALKNRGSELTNTLKKQFGIDLQKELEKQPSGAAPRIFLYENGKLVAPWEKKLTSDELALESAKGKVFLFPDGEKDPVQLQGTMGGMVMRFNPSVPLKSIATHSYEKLEEIPEEPAAKPKPKWYHKMFKFWGNNRRICQEYDTYQQKHAIWQERTTKAMNEMEKSVKESVQVARLVKEQYAPLRSEETLKAERQAAAQREREKATAAARLDLKDMDRRLSSLQKAEDVVENVYAREPKLKEDWVKASYSDAAGLYEREDFQKLSKSDVDLSQIQIGGKPMTEREFSALTMFGTLDPDIAVKAHQNAVGNTEGLLDAFEKGGYSREDGKEFLLKSNFSTYTIEVMNFDGRMSKNFENTVNPGRKRAEEALKAYPQDKSKLADILSRSVEMVSLKVGDYKPLYHGGTPGLYSFAKLSEETMELMKRDPELGKLAKESYEKRAKPFCERNAKLGIKYVSFEDHIKTIQSFNRYAEIERKGMEAEKALLEADLNGTPLTTEQRSAYTKDALKCNVAASLYREQQSKGTDPTYNKEWAALVQHIRELPKQNSGQAIGGKGSSLPSNMPSILQIGAGVHLNPKPKIISNVADPEQDKKLDQMVERLIDRKQLDKLPLHELNRAIKPNGALNGPDVIKELAKENKSPEKITVQNRTVDKNVKEPSPSAQPQLSK